MALEIITDLIIKIGHLGAVTTIYKEDGIMQKSRLNNNGQNSLNNYSYPNLELSLIISLLLVLSQCRLEILI